MKKIILIILFSLSGIFCMAGNVNVRIYGKILNPASKRIVLNYGKKSDTAIITNNEFVFAIDLPYAVHCEIVDDNIIFPVYLTPGDSLFFSVDRRNPLGSWQYSGRGSLYNTAIVDLIKKNNSIISNLQWIFKLESHLFLRKLDSVSLGLQKYFIRYCTEKKIHNKEFIFLEIQRIKYSVASQKFYYASYFPRLTGKEFNDSGFYRFVDTLPQVVSSMLVIPECKQFANMMLDHLVNYHKDRLMSLEGLSMDQIRLRIIADFFFDEGVRNYLFFQTMKNVVYTTPLPQIESMYIHFNNECSDTLYKQEINKIIERKSRLVPGRPAPDFECYDSTGKIVRLSDFRGKMVYLDFWATWCAPCRNEMPHLDKIRDKYRDSGLVVVSISLDETHQKWISTYRKTGLKGIQLYSGDGFYARVARDYFIYSIPLFVLIDRDGMIIRMPAPRPSSSVLTEIISTNLKISGF